MTSLSGSRGRPKRYFDEIATQRQGTYNSTGGPFTGLAAKIQNRVYELIAQNTDQFDLNLTLEAGSGPGRYLSVYCARGLNAVLLDFSREMLKLAQTRGRSLGIGDKLDFVVADLARLPFKEGVFTTVLCVDTLHHIPAGEKSAVVSGLCAVTRQEGAVVLEMKNRLFPLYAAGIPQRRNPARVSVPDNLYEVKKLLAAWSFYLRSTIGITPWGYASTLISPSCVLVAVKSRIKSVINQPDSGLR